MDSGNAGKRTGKAAGIAAITAVNFSWGLDYIFIEYATEYISPQLFSFIRIAVCAAVMLCVSAAIRRRETIRRRSVGTDQDSQTQGRVRAADVPRFLLTGAVGCSLYFTAESIGTDLTSAAFASLIMAFVPIIGMVFDRIFFRSSLTPLKIGCALVSVAGVYFIVCGSPFGINVRGTVMMFAAACLWAGYIALLKPLEERYSETQILTGVFTSGAVFLMPIVAFMGPGKYDASPQFLAVIVISAVAFIIIGNYGYIFAIGRLSVSMVSMFENILPLTSVIFSVILLGRTLAPLQLAGGTIVIIATSILALKE